MQGIARGQQSASCPIHCCRLPELVHNRFTTLSPSTVSPPPSPSFPPDYVRPTLMWLESRGKANLNALVQRYSLEGKLACLTERVEGCPKR